MRRQRSPRPGKRASCGRSKAAVVSHATIKAETTQVNVQQDGKKITWTGTGQFYSQSPSTRFMCLSNAMNAVADPDRYGGNLLEQYAASTVPKIVGQSVASADPYKREVDGVLQSIQSQLPFLREKLPSLRALPVPIIVSLLAETPEEAGEMVGLLDQAEGVAAIELIRMSRLVTCASSCASSTRNGRSPSASGSASPSTATRLRGSTRPMPA